MPELVIDFDEPELVGELAARGSSVIERSTPMPLLPELERELYGCRLREAGTPAETILHIHRAANISLQSTNGPRGHTAPPSWVAGPGWGDGAD